MPETPDTEDPPAAAGERLSIDELAVLTGLTARTVRYYIQQGLVDRPEGAKRGAHYRRRHVEQLLLVRRWTGAGLSLERIRELVAGAPEDPPPRPARPGAVEVWSRALLADGLEVHVEPGRAGLSPEQVRELLPPRAAALGSAGRVGSQCRQASEPSARNRAAMRLTNVRTFADG